MFHLILFPKEFEFFKFQLDFVLYLEKNKYDYILDRKADDNINIYFRIKIEEENNDSKNYYCLDLKLIDDSDIKFLLKLSLFYKDNLNYIKEKCGRNVIVFGTCGYFGNIAKKTGEANFISTVTKYDRGYLDKNGVFKARLDKIIDLKIQTTGVHIFCGNMLCIGKGNELRSFFGSIKSSNEGFVDMETYEFAKLSLDRNLNVKCIRVISDICDGFDNKISRICCNFNEGIIKLINLVKYERNLKTNVSDDLIKEKEKRNEFIKGNLINDLKTRFIKTITTFLRKIIKNEFYQKVKIEKYEFRLEENNPIVEFKLNKLTGKFSRTFKRNFYDFDERSLYNHIVIIYGKENINQNNAKLYLELKDEEEE